AAQARRNAASGRRTAEPGDAAADDLFGPPSATQSGCAQRQRLFASGNFLAAINACIRTPIHLKSEMHSLYSIEVRAHVPPRAGPPCAVSRRQRQVLSLNCAKLPDLQPEKYADLPDSAEGMRRWPNSQNTQAQCHPPTVQRMLKNFPKHRRLKLRIPRCQQRRSTIGIAVLPQQTEEAVAATERRVRRRLKRLREEAKRKSAASSSEHRAAASASSAAACVQRRRKHKNCKWRRLGVQYSRDYKLVLRHLIQQMMEEGQANFNDASRKLWSRWLAAAVKADSTGDVESASQERRLDRLRRIAGGLLRLGDSTKLLSPLLGSANYARLTANLLIIALIVQRPNREGLSATAALRRPRQALSCYPVALCAAFIRYPIEHQLLDRFVQLYYFHHRQWDSLFSLVHVRASNSSGWLPRQNRFSAGAG
uniref:Not1 domain-containing protein n=1 Tax=Macrostomum lignano TaxID=282301 RepID=A0A1I8FJB4_9PLAT